MLEILVDAQALTEIVVVNADADEVARDLGPDVVQSKVQRLLHISDAGNMPKIHFMLPVRIQIEDNNTIRRQPIL